MTELPDGWAEMRLDDAAVVVMGQSPPSSTYNEIGQGLPFFQGKAEFGHVSPVPRKWCVEGSRFAERDDILISVRAPVGPTNVAAERCVIGRGLAAIRAAKPHSQRYLRHFLAHSEPALASQATGTTFAAIRGNVLKGHSVPIPPVSEQAEIVRILDTQLARLDTVLEAVQAVRDRADQLRRSLLHAAFTGQLTQPDPSRGDELPESWSSMTITQALEFSIGGVWGSEPGSDEIDVDVIRVTELKAHGRIDPSSSARRSITSKQLASRRLYEDDLLLEKSGGGPKTPVGRVGLVPRLGAPSVCANFMMLMRTDPSVVRPKFMHLLLNHLHREGMTAPLQKATTNIRNLKTKDYLELPICLPQLDEQDRLLSILGSQLGRLDSALSVADRAEAECGRLRRSVLQAAFRGELTKTWREANG